MSESVTWRDSDMARPRARNAKKRAVIGASQPALEERGVGNRGRTGGRIRSPRAIRKSVTRKGIINCEKEKLRRTTAKKEVQIDGWLRSLPPNKLRLGTNGDTGRPGLTLRTKPGGEERIHEANMAFRKADRIGDPDSFDRAWRVKQRDMRKSGADWDVVRYFSAIAGPQGHVTQMNASEWTSIVIQGGVGWTEWRRDQAIACLIGGYSPSPRYDWHGALLTMPAQANRSAAEFCMEFLAAEEQGSWIDRLALQVSLISKHGEFVRHNSLAAFAMNACATMALRHITRAWNEVATTTPLIAGDRAFVDFVDEVWVALTMRPSVLDVVTVSEVERELTEDLQIGNFLLGNAASYIGPSLLLDPLYHLPSLRRSWDHIGSADERQRLGLTRYLIDNPQMHRLNAREMMLALIYRLHTADRAVIERFISHVGGLA
ncbi:hypothetical protein K438DRAFT_1767716 [Mycena galopus ATCC 62051]|nr:hypothetical protein K438DRAFT_1767716 [Mycena galopus ATCC 62051]